MSGKKLMVRWVGPFRIVQELPTSYMIEHLLTGEQFDVHAIRLKHYADGTLDVTEELKHHVALQGIKLGVRADTEDSWEEFGGIFNAVPEIVDRYVDTCSDTKLKKYRKTLQDGNRA
ncbi:hypothetical protein PHYSODRAFT_329520 [Phytophthora sojae]|uniref:Chromo domain-containing protein n=1 Tax=Phytophthora sojae (strain P6497) TaxID=1094619 RepID=G4Z4Q3_PHYSP|nr:hypothetical protein PHYSODRAFT_329520 [Phytophthora sojae]EGZ21590.1 hypothetical protein PHYSODRAFT_329520 [Phytophthora sojae]|eukprot:XP_009524307.1 hypothetical protein PHYSODRAFT_329520 [Phytophthora sojae]